MVMVFQGFGDSKPTTTCSPGRMEPACSRESWIFLKAKFFQWILWFRFHYTGFRSRSASRVTPFYDFCLGLGSLLSRLYLSASFLPLCKTLQIIKTISRQPSLSPSQAQQFLKDGKAWSRAFLPCWKLAGTPRDTGFHILLQSWAPFLSLPVPDRRTQEGKFYSCLDSSSEDRWSVLIICL